MKKLIPVLLCLSITACQKSTVRSNGSPHKEAATTAASELVIVTTTDFHAAFDKAEGLASAIRELKSKHGDNMLYLDGGDCFQGSLEGNMNKGRSNIAFFNALGVDAMALGNHELDYGPDVLGRINPTPNEDGLGNIKARVAESKFKWLSANFVRTKKRAKSKHLNALGQETFFAPHAIFERAGGRACVIGATTPATAHITNPTFIRGARFESIAKTVEAEVKKLRKESQCTWVILVAHAGLLCTPNGRCLEDADRAEIFQMLRKLPPQTLDAVVAGHTHKRAQEVINGTPVIQAEHSAKAVGVLKLKKQGHAFEPFTEVSENTSVSDITALLKPYRDAAAELKTRVVTTLTAPMPRKYEDEAALGNMIADAVLKAGADSVGADFGLMNAGGIRGDLPEGTLTYGNLYAALPFDNSLAVVELKGSELRRVLEIATSGGHGVAPVSGLRIKRIDAKPGESGTWSRDLNRDGKNEDWERNLILEITDTQGNALQDDKRYRLATIDFLVIGGDHQSIVYDNVPSSRKHLFSGIWVRDLVVEHLKSFPEARPELFYNPQKKRIESVRAN